MTETHSGSAVDLLVIGGGSAGIVAAKTAARFGADVLLVERDRMGGDCLWTGCVPSKSLIAAADAATRARSSVELGVSASSVTVDFAAVMRHVRAAISVIEPTDAPEALGAVGARVERGSARFVGPREAEVGGRRIRFGQAIIATGSAPVMPGIEGLDRVDALTSETVWDIDELPARLLVLGGGAIGCELAQAFARLGSHVTLVQRNARLLPKEDESASAIVAAALRTDGVDVLTGTELESIDAGSGGGGTAALSTGATVPFDRILVALGRTPRVGDLDVAAAHVRLDDRGYVAVDHALRSSNRRIWAAGDVTGLPAFTHLAGVGGSTAATNAVLGLRRRIDRDAVPRVTFTHPEVAAVGVLPDDAASQGCTVSEIQHAHTDRAIAEGQTGGYTRLVIDRRGRVRGATIVGPRAGESIGEACLAVSAGLTSSAISRATHPYPTYSDALWNAAIADVRSRLESGALATVIGVLARVRRLVTR
ncbi:dihydrolipoyl dehydrogenase family protein [Microcella indica]|uniref:dihydrolipoyl dehydrogenase family protein n=1 Tax=Microcella indica TaxID=2750620 RepID=UPI0015CF6D5A|nr:FAD-dependent oxidoreductase [Microcella indica]